MYVVWPILPIHYLPCTYIPLSLFFIAIPKLSGIGFQFSYFRIISGEENISFQDRCTSIIVPHSSRVLCLPFSLCVFTFSFTMTGCRIWDQHSSAHEHAHSWMDTPFHPFFIFIPTNVLTGKNNNRNKDISFWEQLNLTKCRSRDMNMTFIRCGSTTTTAVRDWGDPTDKKGTDKETKDAGVVHRKLSYVRFFPTTGTTIKPIKTKSPNNNKVHYKHIFPFSSGEWGTRKSIHFEQPPETLRILHHFVLLRTLADHLFLPQRHGGLLISPAFQPNWNSSHATW